jgi:energy-coupling factor transport system substrate-specific component
VAEPAVRPSATSPVDDPPATPPGRAPADRRWRTVDIVVTAVLGVAGGVVFWAWDLLWSATGPAFAAFPPAQALMYGIWLLPAVLAPLVVRRPGAALFAELVGGVLSALLGNSWGSVVLLYALLQGLAGELGYAVFAWRRFGRGAALLSAALAGATAAVLDLVVYYPTWSGGWKTAYLAVVVASTLVIAGLGAPALVAALARTGALSSFASGRRRA